MNWNPLIGAARVATGRPDGLERFGTTPASFLASLAPWLAFPLAGALLLFLSGRLGQGLSMTLITLVAQLAPPVLSHRLAARWGREAAWMRYAVAFNWCQWAIPVAGFLFLIVAQVASGMGLEEETAANMVLLALALYGSWLQWLLARHGLQLSRVKSVVLVVFVNAGTLALIFAPLVVQAMLNRSSA